jgi:hypothetical protein
MSITPLRRRAGEEKGRIRRNRLVIAINLIATNKTVLGVKSQCVVVVDLHVQVHVLQRRALLWHEALKDKSQQLLAYAHASIRCQHAQRHDVESIRFASATNGTDEHIIRNKSYYILK